MDLFLEGDTWLHRLDPRVKLLFVGLGTLLCLATLNLPVLVGWLVLTNLLLLSAGVSGGRVVSLWRGFLPVLLLVVLLWPLSYRDGQAIFSLGPLLITDEGVLRGFAFALRLGVLGFVWFVLLLTTDTSLLIAGLLRLGLPYSWGLTFSLALRFFPALIDALGTITDAQMARGLRIGAKTPWEAAKKRLPILVAALVWAIRSAENVSLALQFRGFARGQTRSSYHALRLTIIDLIALALLASLSLVYLYLRFGLGLGASPLG